ncbi:hypothetical protein KPB2_5510 [Klebsiella pneumoniae Kb677]|nr:hypothetical protein KPB2_5510 [Klebsiella pneumoniae Kb677]
MTERTGQRDSGPVRRRPMGGRSLGEGRPIARPMRQKSLHSAVVQVSAVAIVSTPIVATGAASR